MITHIYKKFENYNKLIVLLTAVLAGGIMAFRGTEFFGLLITLITSVILIKLFLLSIDKYLTFILSASYIIRLILIVTHVYIYPLPDSNTDSVRFEMSGWLIAQGWTTGEILVEKNPGFIYSQLIGIIYYFFGRVKVLPLLLNVVLGVVVVYLTYKLIYLISQKVSVSRWGAAIICMIPSSILYSVILRRDIIVMVAVLATTYFFSKWMILNNLKYIIYTLLFYSIGMLFHAGVFFLIIPLFMVIIINKSTINVNFVRKNICNKRLIYTGIVSSILILSIKDRLNEKLPKNIVDILSVDIIKNRLIRLPKGRTMYLQSLFPENYFDVIWQTPVRIFYFLFEPMIWRVESLKDIFGLVDGFLFLIIIFCLIYSLIRNYKTLNIMKKRIVNLLIGILIVQVFVFSWAVSNTGTAIRHRAKFLPVFIAIPMSVGISRNKVTNNEKEDIF